MDGHKCALTYMNTLILYIQNIIYIYKVSYYMHIDMHPHIYVTQRAILYTYIKRCAHFSLIKIYTDKEPICL